MTPMTQRDKELTAKNVLAACKDISKLNKRGYDFINLASGFIAHYDLEGFKRFYDEPGSLQADIERNARMNQWSNFRPGEQNYDYYMAKRDCYNMILGGLVARDVQDAQRFIRDHVIFVHVA